MKALSIVGLILGILSVILALVLAMFGLWFIALIFGIVAIVFAIMTIKAKKGMGIASIILGAIGILLSFLFGFVFTTLFTIASLLG
jgi:hypothetical protein